MKKIPFNINSYIWVKLKEKGLEHYHSQYYKCGVSSPKLEEEDGYYKLQMWEFINFFGDVTYLGATEYYETEIKFEVEE